MQQAALAVSHVWLRYASLKTLRFSGLNQKRACLLVTQDVAGGDLPGEHSSHSKSACHAQNLNFALCMTPVLFATDVEAANLAEPMLPTREQSSPNVLIGCRLLEAAPTDPETSVMGTIDVYKEDNYVMFWRGSMGRVVLKEGCTDVDKLKALWQAAYLQHKGITDAGEAELKESLDAANRGFPEFTTKALDKGWNLNDIII
eukprot:scaffold35495_cov50-Prasinocladus_malaysianus.AAC.2